MSDISDEVNSGPINVAVVDDEEVVHASITRLLGNEKIEGRSFNVTCYFSAQAFLDDNPNQYAVALLDLMMPRIDGLECLKRLHDAKSSVQVVMVTGYPTIKTAVAALQLNVVDYIAKPYTKKEILTSVNNAYKASQNSNS